MSNFDPFGSFETGYNVGSKGRKPLEGVMDAFDEEQKNKSKFKRDVALERVKNEPKAPTDLDISRTNYYNRMAEQKSGTVLTPSQLNQKNKRISDIYSTVETNKIKRNQLNKAREVLPTLPQGLGGKIQVEVMKRFDPNNPTMEGWQNVKSVLTDAQLMNVAKTKGAISDREMELFAQAAANDDMVSVARMKPVLDRLAQFLDAQESSQMDAFQQMYDEDPREWFSNPLKNAVRADRAEDSSVSSPTGDKKSLYNRYRSQGMSAEEARVKAGI